MVWYPHVTVAAVVPRDGRFLMVEEREENGDRVYNQPAGHLEEGETLLEAVIRETLEETGWHVDPVAILSVQLYKSPRNQVTYLRTNFLAEPLQPQEAANLDPEILDVHWMTREAIATAREQLRSDLVWQAIERYESGQRYPLELLTDNQLGTPNPLLSPNVK